VAIDTDPTNLYRIGALGRCHRQHLAGCGADSVPPGVGILLAWICSTAGRAPRDGDRRASLGAEQECFDRGAPEVEGEKRSANGSTHQVRRR
jgi:hypothetical protein